MDTMALNKNISKLLSATYGWMFYALGISGLVASIMATILTASPALMTSFIVLFILAAIAEIGIVIYFGMKIEDKKLSFSKSLTLFTVYSALNGFILAPIFLHYTAISIATTFFIVAGMFAIMSLIGYFTKIDLSKLGSILFMCLIGLIIATVINMFIASSALYWVVTYAGVLIFIGLTAYDTQQLKHVLYNAIDDQGIVSDQAGKITLWFALELYLDFVNLLLMMLRLLGNNK